jgi:hypothetical protein
LSSIVVRPRDDGGSLLCVRFYLLVFVRFAPFRGYSDLTFLTHPHLRKSAVDLRLTSVFVSIRVHPRFVFALFVPLADVAKGGDGATCPP